jgi:GNAT superfamily N-acetyltransferase
MTIFGSSFVLKWINRYMRYRIQRAKSEREWEQIYALDLLCFGIADGSMGSVDDMVGSDWWIVWNENYEPVGYCGVVIYDDFAIHKRCGVLPCARGNGLQKRMLKTRENFAKKNKCGSILTYVSIQNIISANNLISTGYRVYNPSWRWGGDHYLYVQKMLEKPD